MTDQYSDVELNDDEGYYDISFDGGDFKKIKGWDTAIWLSIFTDARAAPTQIERPENRRGWIGNLNNPVELGSLNWLYEQARLITATANGLLDSTKNCLQWFVDLEYATGVIVDVVKRNAITLDVDVKLLKPDGSVNTTRVSLWDNTPSRD